MKFKESHNLIFKTRHIAKVSVQCGIGRWIGTQINGTEWSPEQIQASMANGVLTKVQKQFKE